MAVLTRVVASPVTCARLSLLLDETLELQPIFARQLGRQVLSTGGGFVLSILGAPYHFRICSLLRAIEAGADQQLLEGTVGAETSLGLVWFVPAPAAIPLGAAVHDWAAEAHAELFADMTAALDVLLLGGSSPHAALLQLPPSLLLVGEPGVGKSFFAAALCAHYSCRQVSSLALSTAELLSLSAAVAVRLLELAYARAEAAAPCLLVLEDVDLLGLEEDSIAAAVGPVKLALQRMCQAQGSARRGVCTFAIARSKEAAPRVLRESSRVFELLPPGPAQRRLALQLQLRYLVPGGNVQALETACASVTERMSGFTASDVARAARRAAALASLRQPQAPTLLPADILAAVGCVQPSLQLEDPRGGAALSVAGVSWADVGGYAFVRQYFQELLQWPATRGAAMRRLGLDLPSGALLFGPSGCGKTLCVRAFAAEARRDFSFIAVRGPEVFSKYLGDAERFIRRTYDQARKLQPCIVFFDEVDAVAGRRQEGGESGVYERVLTQLLTELDGVAARGRVFTLACSSRPWLLDPAFLRPGRVDRLLYVPPPTLTDRLDILQQRCAGGVLHEEVSLQWLAEATEGLSGAELVALLREAALDAERAGRGQLRVEDLQRQLRMEREPPALQPYLDFLAGRTG